RKAPRGRPDTSRVRSVDRESTRGEDLRRPDQRSGPGLTRYVNFPAMRPPLSRNTAYPICVIRSLRAEPETSPYERRHWNCAALARPGASPNEATAAVLPCKKRERAGLLRMGTS